jgi:hypothetical protein
MAVFPRPAETGQIKNGGFAGGIKGRINLAARLKLNSCPFQTIDELAPRFRSGDGAPANTGVAAYCEQFETISPGSLILKIAQAKNECICLKCGVLT